MSLKLWVNTLGMMLLGVVHAICICPLVVISLVLQLLLVIRLLLFQRLLIYVFALLFEFVIRRLLRLFTLLWVRGFLLNLEDCLWVGNEMLVLLIISGFLLLKLLLDFFISRLWTNLLDLLLGWVVSGELLDILGRRRHLLEVDLPLNLSRG
jgi:hypothetical protein